MNPILEDLHPDKGAVARRRAKGFPPLHAATDHYTAYLHAEMGLCYLNGLEAVQVRGGGLALPAEIAGEGLAAPARALMAR